MSDSDKSYNIDIHAAASGDGAAKTKAQLDAAAAAAKNLGAQASSAENNLGKLGDKPPGAPPPQPPPRARALHSPDSHRDEGGSSDPSTLPKTLDQLAGKIPLIGGLGSALAKLASGPIAAVAAAFGGAAAAVDAFAGKQTKFASFDAALSTTGQLTTEARDKFLETAAAMREATAMDFLPVVTQLAKFGATAKTIDATAEAVKNLAGLTGGDLSSATEHIARAMGGSYEAFSRIGIKIPELLPPAEKLNYLFEQLALRGGGQLEARLQTLGGQWDVFKESTGKALSGFGGWIASVTHLSDALYGLGKSASWVAGLISAPVPPLQGLRNAAIATRFSFDELQQAERNFALQQQGLAQMTNAIVESLTAEAAALDHAKSRADETARAETALAEARIRARVSASDPAQRITPAEADSQIAALHQKSADNQTARDLAAIQAKYDKEKQLLAVLEADRDRARQAVKEFEAQDAAAKQRQTDEANVSILQRQSEREAEDAKRALAERQKQRDAAETPIGQALADTPQGRAHKQEVDRNAEYFFDKWQATEAKLKEAREKLDSTAPAQPVSPGQMKDARDAADKYEPGGAAAKPINEAEAALAELSAQLEQAGKVAALQAAAAKAAADAAAAKAKQEEDRKKTEADLTAAEASGDQAALDRAKKKKAALDLEDSTPGTAAESAAANAVKPALSNIRVAATGDQTRQDEAGSLRQFQAEMDRELSDAARSIAGSSAAARAARAEIEGHKKEFDAIIAKALAAITQGKLNVEQLLDLQQGLITDNAHFNRRINQLESQFLNSRTR